MTRSEHGHVSSRGIDRAALREAFAAEVSSRLPSMATAAAAMLAEGAVGSARELARHAHTLASGAAVVGEDLAARHARACQLALEPYLDAARVPSGAVDAALDELSTMSVLLAPWLTSGGDRVR